MQTITYMEKNYETYLALYENLKDLMKRNAE